MEAIVVAFVALLVILLVLLIPSGGVKRDLARHEQTLADMQLIADEAKAQMTEVHRAYRAHLSQAAKAQAAAKRRRP